MRQSIPGFRVALLWLTAQQVQQAWLLVCDGAVVFGVQHERRHRAQFLRTRAPALLVHVLLEMTLEHAPSPSWLVAWALLA